MEKLHCLCRWRLKQKPETSALSGVSIVIFRNCRRGDETIQEKPLNRSGEESQKSRIAVARRGAMNFLAAAVLGIDGAHYHWAENTSNLTVHEHTKE
ncbi:hypothetical protein F2Q69_00029739 [Brassica cretica]|uniref:Uncharacterized protein n=1 Tax=Brassica cretica TaxID=69181 RepID=A0A8S9S6D8_BRACR|nr:hypothetical protein F2Q69_00029739 [Brassica cretica]